MNLILNLINFMKNILLNFLQGNRILDSIDTDIYLNSLNKFKTFEKAIFVNDVSDTNIEKLKKYYTYVIKVEESLIPINFCYLSYYNWLCKNIDKYCYVLHTDMRDVILQNNPFDFMLNNSDKNMFLVCEGMKISENDCNKMWHDSVRKTLAFKSDSYDDSLILNGGVYGGKIDAFLNHCTLILMAMNRRYNYYLPDQAMLGYLSEHLKKNPFYLLCHPYENTFCATGEAIKYKNIDVKFIDNLVCDLHDNPYFIYHQWDRTEHAEKIRNKFKNTLSFSL